MTKDEYWLKQLEKNPKLINKEHKIQITSENLRKLLNDAWEKGFNHKQINPTYKEGTFQDIFHRYRDDFEDERD